MISNARTSSPHRRLLTLSRIAVALGILAVPAPANAQHGNLESVAHDVADAVCGRQVVLLGELPSHGEARAFEAKAAIVQRLVERCGFDVLLFEAPVYDFIAFDAAAAQRAATSSQLDRAIGRFWWTRELAPWRAWLFSRATAGALVLGGIDDQVSATADHARAALPGMVAATSSLPEHASRCGETVARNLNWSYNADTPFDDPEKARLHECVRSAADAAAARAGERRTQEQVMLESLASYVARQVDASGAPERGAAMYRNVLWHVDRLPAGSRVIIWTATVHASREQGPLAQQPLGARLAARWGTDVAAIGFTAFAGSSSMAGQPARPLPETPPGSLEALATGDDVPWVFLDGPALRRLGLTPSRLLGRIAEADWSRHFDGVVVIREEVAPLFDAWK